MVQLYKVHPCAQRLTASDMESPDGKMVGNHRQQVLNALRHLIWNHVVGLVSGFGLVDVLNALRHLIWNHLEIQVFDMESNL